MLERAVQGLRVGTGPQQAFLAAGVLMVWALFLRLAIALTWWIVPIVWMIWCAVFWRPSLTAAIIEFVSAGVPLHTDSSAIDVLFP